MHVHTMQDCKKGAPRGTAKTSYASEEETKRALSALQALDLERMSLPVREFSTTSRAEPRRGKGDHRPQEHRRDP